LTNRNAEVLRTAYAAMELTARFVIVPLALASLLSGVVQSMGTPWGLFRHYWMVVKLLLTTFATIVLLAKMSLIGYAARRAVETTPSSVDLHTAGIQLAAHATGGMLVLLVITAVSVYKPWGLTRYGQRKQQERRDEPRRSRPAVVVKAVSGRDKEIIGDRLSRALGVSLAAGVGSGGAYFDVPHRSWFSPRTLSRAASLIPKTLVQAIRNQILEPESVIQRELHLRAVSG
jgi:hypothetical protein